MAGEESLRLLGNVLFRGTFDPDEIKHTLYSTKVMGKEISNVQFRDLEEQLFRAMAVLFDQKQRQCVAKLEHMRAPASLFTPTVSEPHVYEEEVEAYVQELFRNCSFAVPREEALKRVKERDMRSQQASKQTAAYGEEPRRNKRRVSGAQKTTRRNDGR